MRSRNRAIALIGFLLCFCLAFGAAAESMTEKAYYDTGLQYLRKQNAEDVATAVVYFESAGNYGQAKLFAVYAQALGEIFAAEEDNNNLTLARMDLELVDIPEFADALAENNLPSVAELKVYIQARRYEIDGRYDEAVEAYRGIMRTLDALNRQRNIAINKNDMIYQKAVGLFEAKDYIAAAKLFRELDDWKDSAEMYEKCMALHEHAWIAATCLTPKTCSACGAVDGSPLGHDWREATCTEPRTCARCGQTEGNALGHNWKEATCTEPKTCKRCGAVEGEALGHDWQEATYTAPKTCKRCGKTEGTKLAQPIAVGNYITFGHYEQNNDTVSGREKIEWLVLDIDEVNHRALLLSRHGLDAKPYNKPRDLIITWEDCTLRTWLNSDFLNEAFTAKEQSAILTTAVDNSNGQGYSKWSTYGGSSTRDKIFLLSYAEANKYLGVTYENRNNTKARVAPTAYAIKQGAIATSSNATAENMAAVEWWLRSPALQGSAAFVQSDGSLISGPAYYTHYVVRPALWVNLDADIF